MSDPSNLHIYNDLEQGSDEWIQARCGILTASVIGQLITPKTVKVAENVESRALAATLASERITGRVEESFTSRKMDEGHFFEPMARELYASTYAPVTEVGFMVRKVDGHEIGFSPDGLVNDDGIIEIKTREPKKHLATILANEVPAENLAQCHAGMYVSGRDWCDYISYSNGLPMYTIRLEKSEQWFDSIEDALNKLEQSITTITDTYMFRTNGLPVAEYIDLYEEIEIQ